MILLQHLGNTSFEVEDCCIQVVYYILKNHSENFEFSYFNSPYYRGVGMLKNIKYFRVSEDAIIEINNYEYNIDFPNYLKFFQ